MSGDNDSPSDEDHAKNPNTLRVSSVPISLEQSLRNNPNNPAVNGLTSNTNPPFNPGNPPNNPRGVNKENQCRGEPMSKAQEQSHHHNNTGGIQAGGSDEDEFNLNLNVNNPSNPEKHHEVEGIMSFMDDSNIEWSD